MSRLLVACLLMALAGPAFASDPNAAKLQVVRKLSPENSPYVGTQLLKPTKDLRKAREGVARFWMNNQPSVLTYERLNEPRLPEWVETLDVVLNPGRSLAEWVRERIRVREAMKRIQMMLDESEDL